MVKSNSALYLCPIMLLLVAAGCATPRSVTEWNRTAKTTEPTLLYECTIFTGNWSIWSGPHHSMCLGKVPFSDRGAPPPVPVAAGTRVDVQEILTYRLVDAYYDQARIHVFLETGPTDA